MLIQVQKYSPRYRHHAMVGTEDTPPTILIEFQKKYITKRKGGETKLPYILFLQRVQALFLVRGNEIWRRVTFRRVLACCAYGRWKYLPLTGGKDATTTPLIPSPTDIRSKLRRQHVDGDPCDEKLAMLDLPHIYSSNPERLKCLTFRKEKLSYALNTMG
ncbi:hypothetical protein CEXT_545551 [Caerostris extrusa]|uniref:Uncharacterized protein n=1 Tax=Caerostris extrusa TaxID=172846 RepID=A0AAV4NCZ1_CAEEX|nr:hypothetical protein CEXT_545551 [Caerostris extrusa]